MFPWGRAFHTSNLDSLWTLTNPQADWHCWVVAVLSQGLRREEAVTAGGTRVPRDHPHVCLLGRQWGWAARSSSTNCLKEDLWVLLWLALFLYDETQLKKWEWGVGDDFHPLEDQALIICRLPFFWQSAQDSIDAEWVKYKGFSEAARESAEAIQ